MLDRVPYEVFSKIIKFSNRHSINVDFDFDDQTSLPPIKATRVCRSWRNTLIRDPSMWTSIRVKYTEVNSVELFKTLSRSSSLPLNVFIEKGDKPFLPHHFVDLISVLPRVTQEMHRVRQLQILIPENMAGAILSLLKYPAPVLQTLYFELESREETNLFETEEWLSALQETFSKNLFLENSPNLKHVHLPISAGLEEINSASLFQNLSTIHLQFISMVDIDYDKLLLVLRSSPCLRVLNLSMELIWAEARPARLLPPTCRIHMPYLRELSLRGKCTIEIVDFISTHLEFPVDKIDFDITCACPCSEIHHHSTSLIHLLSQRRFSAISVSSDYDFSFFEQEPDPESSTSILHSGRKAVFTSLHNSKLITSSHMDLFGKFNTWDITHVYLEDVPIDLNPLRHFLLSLKNVQYLRIKCGIFLGRLFFLLYLQEGLLPPDLARRHILQRFLQAVSESEAEESENTTDSELVNSTNFESIINSNPTTQPRSFPCPSLHTLELVLSDATEFDASCTQALAVCSEIRGEAGHPFRSVLISCKTSLSAERVRDCLQDLDYDTEIERLRDIVEVRVSSVDSSPVRGF